MPFPKTEAEFIQAGYIFDDDSGGQCESCKRSIHWVTTPAGRKMPLDDNGDGTFTSHFATCDNPNRFRRRERR